MGRLKYASPPAGARRRYFDALRDLHQSAGERSVRELSQATGASHGHIYNVFTKADFFPTWGLLEVLLEALGVGESQHHYYRQLLFSAWQEHDNLSKDNQPLDVHRLIADAEKQFHKNILNYGGHEYFLTPEFATEVFSPRSGPGIAQAA